MAKNIRVHELAKELGMTDSEAMDLCGVLGVPVKSPSSAINVAYADMVRRRAERDGLTREEPPNELDWPEQASVRPLDSTVDSPGGGAERAQGRRLLRSVPAGDRGQRATSDFHTPNEQSLGAPVSEPLPDPLDRAEMLFPYPVAALVRSTRVSEDAHVLRDAYLKLGEALVRAYGLVAVSSSGLSVEEVFGRGAISAGSWLAATRKAADSSRSLPAGYSWVETKGNAGWHLAQLVSLRNKSHHKHGVDSLSQVNAVVRHARDHVEAVLTQSSWLSNSRWVGVSRCEYTDQGHVLRARVLRGSDAQWIRDSIPVDTPAVPGSVLAIDSETEEALDMSQLARMVDCEDCRRDELFLLDSVGATSTFVCTAGHTIKVPTR